MPRLLCLIAILFAVAVLPGAATAQDDPFASLHSRLIASVEKEIPQQAPSPVLTRGEKAKPQADAINTFARQFWGAKTASLTRALSRVEALRPALEPILREAGISSSFVAVMLVESAGRQDALSPAGARGLWQFMPDTARRYGLEVSPSRDDRLHLERSTRAAALHLRDLYADFGSWDLALAAYNAGAGRVRAAVATAGATEFAAVSRNLPLETRAYVPAVLAAMELLGEQPPVDIKRPAGTLVYASFARD